MSSTPPTGGRLLVEPLEARIAPTGLTAISNNTAFSTDPTYVTYTTQPSSTHLGFVPASTYLGASAPANVYAIKLTGDGSINSATGLSNGDKLLVFNLNTGFNPNSPFLQATNKTVLAFFQDLNGDNQVQGNEMVGLSLAKKASASVNGNVNGDIVTNLSKDGSMVNLASVGNSKTSIAGLSINGNVTGSILAGGDITNVSIVGNANNIFAGTATDGSTYHFGGVNANGAANPATGTISEGAFPDAKIGASIIGLSVTSLTNGAKVYAGAGGLGATGGSITGLTVLSETTGFTALAGNGGVGNAAIKGGTGGDIVNATIVGVAGTAPGALITLHAGNGGENDAFKGGAGGAVTGVGTNFNQFDAVTNTGTVSADFLLQSILVHGGDGGTGLKGGRGGNVTSSSIFSAAPDDGVVTAGGANAEIQVIAGHGGVAFANDRGHGGNGGSISQVFAENFNADVTNPDLSVINVTDSVLVQAGDGGAGRAGGNLDGIGILGAQIIANAGNGTDGINKGGLGGNVNTLNILNQTNLFTHQLTINAGRGGAASNGAGGAGGNVSVVSVLDSDLNLLVINGGTQANGGVGSTGLGGAGGSVTNVQINDSDLSGTFAAVTVRAGAGANGFTGGGNGGDIGNATSPVQMFGSNFGYTATAGAGGSVLANGSGNGGNGGSLDTVGFSSVTSVNQIEVGQSVASVDGLANYTALTGTATAGAGGSGPNQGGLGGSLAGVNLRAGFDIALTAGAGGAGGSGSGGDGGSVLSSAGVSLGGAVSVFAGNAAGAGSFAANGGRLQAVIASAQTSITMVAGSGGIGGAGGDIVNAGTTANPLYVDPTFDVIGNFVEQTVSNFGNVTITAGAGSSANGVAGQGGSITNFTGSIGLGGAADFSNFDTHTTTITAGAGGGGEGQTASGAGGSVTGLKLTGNTLQDYFGGQNVTVDAGNAGQATGAKKGAAGGEVNAATIFNLDFATNVQHVAAGDGGVAVKKGGAGGSITEIHVGQPGDATADIGVRSGAAYGYGLGSAGGIFAGVGGTGKKLVGVNGDVTHITANAISSIVAGKTGTVHLVNLVDDIQLEGNVAAAVTPGGSYTNFNVANIVGSVQNPNLAGDTTTGAGGASTYHAGDGLVAALNVTMTRNFFLDALLTVDPNSGALVFVDYQLPKTTPVTTTTIPFSASL